MRHEKCLSDVTGTEMLPSLDCKVGDSCVAHTKPLSVYAGAPSLVISPFSKTDAPVISVASSVFSEDNAATGRTNDNHGFVFTAGKH